jgi:hypothetical protein
MSREQLLFERFHRPGRQLAGRGSGDVQRNEGSRPVSLGRTTVLRERHSCHGPGLLGCRRVAVHEDPPLVGVTLPATHRSKVVLPEPFALVTATLLPGPSSRSSRLRTQWSANSREADAEKTVSLG